MENQELSQTNSRPSVVVETAKVSVDQSGNLRAVEVKQANHRPLMLNIWSQTINKPADNSIVAKVEEKSKKDQSLLILYDIQHKMNNFEKDLQNIRKDIHSNKDSYEKISNILQFMKKSPCSKCKQCHQCTQNGMEVDHFVQSTMQELQQHIKSWNVPSGSHLKLRENESPTSSRLATMSTYTSPESNQYTIIAQGNSAEDDSPIEIKLANIPNEDNNSNTSTDDPNRRHICLDSLEPDTIETKPTNEALNFNPINKEIKQLPKKRKYVLKNNNIEVDSENIRMVVFGPHNTTISEKVYNNINWESGSKATRQLLMALFDRQYLASHSLSGKPSPAFPRNSKPTKDKLDEFITEDIIDIVSRKSNISPKQVRSAITTKCADENKMMKRQQMKIRKLSAAPENITF